VVSSTIVVMLSLGVVNELVERRRRQRWSVLAQYVLFELVRNARMTWSGIIEAVGLLPIDGNPQVSVEAGARTVRDTERLHGALRSILGDENARLRLCDEFAFLAEHADEVLGRWANVMLNAEVYAEVIDRHVELAGDIAWIDAVLEGFRPSEETSRRYRRSRSSAAIQIESDLSPGWLADRIVVITQLAERLDRGTLDLALRIVPVEWWQSRLGTAVPPT
jgi:hypothetical protein